MAMDALWHLRSQLSRLGLWALLLSGLAGVAPGAERPNVLIIYTDDQGSIDANCYGAKDLVTPHMDRLAREGVRFTQMLAPSAICSASRAGLLTGRFPVRAGVPGNAPSTPGRAGGLPPGEMTMADLLKSAGYATALIGKWHLGYTPALMPNAQGFDYAFGHLGGCIDNYSHYFYWSGPNRHDLWRNGQEIHLDGEYFPDLIVAEAERFITEHRERPFFLYVAINLPHYPLQGTEKWRSTYAHLPEPRRMYAEFLSTMDERIGEIIGHLDDLGLRERTLVIVQSDHGHSVEERTFFGGGNAGPFRGAKSSLFEGGLRVPSFVRLPGRVPAGEVREQFVTGCDWFPTVAEWCGISPPPIKIDGRSIARVIADPGAPSPHDSFYWHLGAGNNLRWAVRRGDWKLLGNPNDPTGARVEATSDKLYLVNLKTDIGEKTNVAQQHPQVLADLRRLQQEYSAEVMKR
jgi:arylsulfatase A